jgi:Zn-dependent oligopeptidase
LIYFNHFCLKKNKMNSNPLLSAFDLAPFSQIKNEHFLPAFQVLIKQTKDEIEAIAVSTEKATFENTIEALEFSGEQLDRVSSIFFNLNSAETNDEIQQIAQEVSPLLSELSNDISLHAGLFLRVKEVYETCDTSNLTAEQKMLLDKKYKGFVRNGANLSSDKKEILREIDKELSVLKLKFGENVLAEMNRFELLVESEDELSGLPQDVKDAAENLAKNKDKNGWMFTLAYPSYLPLMKYADNRELRKKMALAAGSQAFKGDEFDNQKNVLRIVELKHKRAQLLGYESHAHFVLEERMASNPDTVIRFLTDLLQKAKPVASKEFQQLSDFAKELDGIEQLQKWDGAYYTEKLKNKLFNLDDEKLKPYFALDKVLNGAFILANRLFGLNFKKINNIDVYHSEVESYEVTNENGEFISYFYADFHPRPGKRNGAWMTSFKDQKVKNGHNDRPHISNVCNFSRPTDSKPALLTFNEVTTLFHEFGHGLHGMLANTTYPSLSGTSVYWDFVELPSQIYENWCYEKECLDLFAEHYETGEKLPIEFIEKIKESSNFMEGMATVRQLSFGLLDMTWHSRNPENYTSVKEVELEAMKDTLFYPDVAENCMSVSFSHIFGGGYSSGYYSYKWAEVLDADAFEFFKEKGLLSREIGKAFEEHILSKGGSEHPMELYKRFRGREPQPEALLKRAGLLEEA